MYWMDVLMMGLTNIFAWAAKMDIEMSVNELERERESGYKNLSDTMSPC